MNINVIGLDIAKNSFHLIGLNTKGAVVLKKKLRRSQVLSFFANLKCNKISMEGCGSSHYWARELSKLAHQVTLLPAQYVKPLVRGNKNDYNDALAIAEASLLSEMRCVGIKSIEQQSIQALHRLRSAAVRDRTALSNQVRGLLAEFGLVCHQGIATIRKQLPRIIEDGESELPHLFRQSLDLKYTQFCQLDELIDQLTELIETEAKEHEEIQLLQSTAGYRTNRC